MSTGTGRRRRRAAPRSISLALQGGGAHGAFTWGVLDALLEDGRLDLRGASGTSAGALNAASLVTGLATGGAQAAREARHSMESHAAAAVDTCNTGRSKLTRCHRRRLLPSRQVLTTLACLW